MTDAFGHGWNVNKYIRYKLCINWNPSPIRVVCLSNYILYRGIKLISNRPYLRHDKRTNGLHVRTSHKHKCLRC